MPRIRRLMRGVSRLVFAAVVVGLGVGPEVVRGKVDEILVASWKAAGEALVRHDLTTMTSRLDKTRAELQRARARRDTLARRLCELEASRQTARTRAEQGLELLRRITTLLDRLPDGEDRAGLEREARWHLQRSLGTSREVARLDAATLVLADDLASADRQIQAAEDRLSVRRSELAVLRAAEEARQLRLELASVDGVPPCWETQAARVAGFLQPLNPLPSIEPHPSATRHQAALSPSQDSDD